MDILKIGNLFLPALVLVGSEVWTRVAVQGVEQGLLSMALDWSVRLLKKAPGPLSGLETCDDDVIAD